MEENKKHTHICIMHSRVKSCSTRARSMMIEKKDENDSLYYECENGEPLADGTGGCQLPKIFGLCNNHECRLLAKLDEYRETINEKDKTIGQLKAANTAFRNMMFGPIMMEKFLSDGTITHSGIHSYINEQRSSWDKVDMNTILFAVEFHQQNYLKYAEYAHEKNSKINIKAELETKREDETAATKKKVKEEENDKTPYGKAVRGYLKLGMPQEQAEKIVQSMGLKPIIKCEKCQDEIKSKEEEMLLISKKYLCISCLSKLPPQAGK